MDFLKCKMPKSVFEQLTPDQRHLIEVSDVEPDDFDYSGDEIHKELKSISTKAYKELKKREYEIRFNIK